MQDKELLEQSQELVKSIFEKMTSIESLGTLKNSVGVGNVGIVMTDGGVIALDVLTVDQVSKVKEYIVSLIEENMKEDRHFLSRLNLLSRKPAVINQDFENAVQEMVDSAKTESSESNDDEEIKLTPELLYKAYVEDDIPVSKIAEQYGMTKYFVHKMIDENGFKQKKKDKEFVSGKQDFSNGRKNG